MLRRLALITALSRSEPFNAKARVVVCLVAMATILWIGGVRADTEGGNGKCYKAWLAEKPRWVASLLARQESPPLILVDPVQNKLLGYRQDGSSEILPTASIRDEMGFLPTAVGRSDGGDILLELADGTVVQLNRNFGITRVILSLQARSSRGLRVGSLYQWKLAGNYMVAYGALLDERDNIIRGFFRIPITGSSQAPELLMPLADSDFYLVGNSYIATIGATAYYVAMEKSPAIFRVYSGQNPERLLSFPEEFRLRPDFKTDMTGPRSAAQHFSELEKFAVASGLYSQGEFLYLLTRRPNLGRTEWSLYKIDPLRDRVVSKVKLPTSANHLSVASSESKWFFIQKGPVQDRQRQDIDSMIVIDGSEFLSSKKFADSCLAIAVPSTLKRTNFSARSYYFVIAAMVLGLAAVLSIVRLIRLSKNIQKRG